MLVFPDITIVLFSGTEELTARMVDEIKQHFLMNGDFREMYPGWVPQKNISEFGQKGSFTCLIAARSAASPRFRSLL
jgi:hypothetical protein